MSTSGIYFITCRANGMKYIGSSQNIEKRWWHHRALLVKGRHDNHIIQSCWNKYGEKSFDWEIVQHVENRDWLLPIEQSYLDWGFRLGKMMNMALDARAAMRGRKYTAAQSKRLSEAKKGFRHTPETIELQRKQKRDRDLNRPEIQAKITAAHRGAKRSTRVKLILRRAHPTKPVVQRTPDTSRIVAIYPSLHEADRNGFIRGNITRVIDHPTWLAHGFRWSYATPIQIEKSKVLDGFTKMVANSGCARPYALGEGFQPNAESS